MWKRWFGFDNYFIFNASVGTSPHSISGKKPMWFQCQRHYPYKTSTKTSGKYISLRPCPKFWNQFLQIGSSNPSAKHFGPISGCCAVDALVSMLHTWYADTDGNGKTVRLFLLDFSKAFDQINHQILISEMHKLDMDQAIINWLGDPFLIWT